MIGGMGISSVTGLFFQFDRKPEGGALARLAAHADFAFHQCHQLLGDRQSQTGASVPAGGGPIGLAKRLKELPLSFG